MVNNMRFILVLCTLYIVPLYFSLWAHTSMLSIGVRGGGQTYLPDAALGASGEVKPAFGGTGTLDLRYSFYGCLTDRFGIGFTLGAGIGYGTAGIQGNHTDTYTNFDYLGNQMDYTVSSAFKQTDRFAKGEATLMASFCFGNVILNLGPRFMVPFAATGTVTISEASIDAYYPLYDVHVTDQLITGKLETPYQQTTTSSLPPYTALMALELGYEWTLNTNHSLGVQLFADIAVWTPKSSITNVQSPMISVAPISNANDPVPSVIVNSPAALISSRRYLDFGIRAYYAFSSSSARRSPARDTRLHHNRYLWW